jgi:hypothetical protein
MTMQRSASPSTAILVRATKCYSFPLTIGLFQGSRPFFLQSQAIALAEAFRLAVSQTEQFDVCELGMKMSDHWICLLLCMSFLSPKRVLPRGLQLCIEPHDSSQMDD